ncbi:MAG: hypothetical protein JNL54_08575, partial [Kineosporiaceae bacterium]|nr:hypothetical protein [Kineosporiaceae bacterium]
MSEQGSGGYVPTRPAWSTTRDRSAPAEATADRAPTRVDTSPPVPAVVQIPDAAPPVVLARPRFAQLTYTAFAVTGSVRGAGSGGWQVKQESGEPDAREREVMSREVVTGLRLVTPPPRFPSRDEIESLPRRLAFRRTPVGDVWCHAVPAGNDVTGRPNNVFSHVLLDRSSVRPNDGPDTAGAAGSAASPAATSDERAIQLWRGERWLTPYGADEVQEAVLAEEPRPGEWFSLRALAEFLFDLEAGRFSVMGLLLDAVAAALAGGPPVVLAAPTPDEGAWWIALVQRLTSPTVAGRVSFSTFDRLDAVSTGGTDRLLTVVPDTDVETTSLGARPLVLIDHRDDPQ